MPKLDTLRLTGSGAIDADTLDADAAKLEVTGSGDLTTAIFLANLLETGDLGASLSMTASTVYSVLLRTHELGRRELALVQAQDDIVNPKYRFDAVPL